MAASLRAGEAVREKDWLEVRSRRRAAAACNSSCPANEKHLGLSAREHSEQKHINMYHSNDQNMTIKAKQKDDKKKKYAEQTL